VNIGQTDVFVVVLRTGQKKEGQIEFRESKKDFLDKKGKRAYIFKKCRS